MSSDHWRTIPGFVTIGRAGTTHGNQGELKIRIEESYLPVCLDSAYLFFDVDGDCIPFRVDSFRYTGDLLVRLDVTDFQPRVADLVGSKVYLPSDEVEEISPNTVDSLEYGYLVGYSIVDSNNGDLGSISEVRAYPQQELAVIEVNGNEVLVPLNDTFITEVDRDARTVHVNLPEGLIDFE